jgi:hypothetical protein
VSFTKTAADLALYGILGALAAHWYLKRIHARDPYRWN